MSIAPERSRRWGWRATLCVIATTASLSRTDLLLDFGFGVAMLYMNRRQLLLKFAGLMKLGGVFVLVALLTPFLLQLDVVQQRISRGVGDNDQSLGWRLLENVTLLDHFMRGTAWEIAFGFGLGARLPLPPGVVDFTNHTSIPTLHNSYGTIALKVGVMGLLILFGYLWRVTRHSYALQDPQGEPYRRTGRWIALVCVGKALTLHGLTEWSHVVFFGIACMLMQAHVDRARAPYGVLAMAQ